MEYKPGDRVYAHSRLGFVQRASTPEDNIEHQGLHGPHYLINFGDTFIPDWEVGAWFAANELFPAPVAPQSGDAPITVDEMIAFLQDTSVDQRARIIGAIAWLRGYQAETVTLRAANAALQARNADLAETMQHIAVKVREVALAEDIPPDHLKALWDLGTDLIRIAQTPAPNGGATAAHLCSVIGCGKVATHVSDVKYRDGVKAHYCDEHSLYERPIDTAGAETVAPLVTTKGRVIRPGPNLVATFGPAAMLADALAKKLDRLDTTPAQPATARKLSSVKLTAAQIAVLEWLVFKDGRTINAVGQSYHNGIHWGFYFRYPTFRVLKDKGLIEPAEAEQLGKFTAYRISAAGVAALGARESEAK